MTKKYFFLLIAISSLMIAVDIFNAYQHSTLFSDSIKKQDTVLTELYDFSNFLSLIKDAEAGVRGYVITGLPEFLEPYQSALRYFDSNEFKDFFSKKLTGGSRKRIEQQNLLLKLKDEKFEEFAQIIATREREGFEASRELIISDQTKGTLDSITRLIENLVEEKLLLISNYHQHLIETVKETFDQLLYSDLAEVILLAICLFFFYRSLDRLSKRDKELSSAKNKLIESMAIQNAIFESAQYAILATDAKGLITAFNPAAEKLLGYSKEEVIGIHTPEIFHDEKEMERSALAIFKKYHEKTEGFDRLIGFAKRAPHETSEWSYIRKDGTAFPALRSVTCIHNSKNKTIGYVGFIQDITQKRQVDRLKEELLAIAGFELREPIASVKGVLDLISMENSSLSKKGQQLIEIGKRNCNQLVRTVNQILEKQQLEVGKLNLILTNANLASILKIVVQNQLQNAKEAHIEIIFNPPKRPLEVEVDSEKLNQVINNLLYDSIHRSPPESKIIISVQQIDDKARVEIRDQTPFQITTHYSEVFKDSLSQPSTVDVSKISNYLGLRMAKSIIAKHHGRMGFNSTPSSTCFWFELPIITK